MTRGAGVMRAQAFLLAVAGVAGVAAIAPGCAGEEEVGEDESRGYRGGEGEGEGEGESEPLPPGRCRRDRHCDDPPTPCHVSPGICEGGGCSYQIGDGMSCDDPEACVFGGTCRAGQCLGPSCEEDVAPSECVSDTTLRVYRGPGRCTEGGCEYDFDDRECARGCEVDRCGNLCAAAAGCPFNCDQAGPAQIGTQTGNTAVGAGIHGGSCVGQGAPEQVWALIPDQGGALCVNLDGSYDPGLHVRTECANPASEIACNDDSNGLNSQVTFSVVAGTVYYIFADGFGSSSGAYTLTIRQGSCPAPF